MAPPLKLRQPCKNCGQPAERYQSSRGNWIYPRYCDACQQQFRRPSAERHPRWRGGERSSKDGYIRVWVSAGKRDLEHRVVWIAANGPIPRNMHIHHRNGDKADNRLENLQLVGNSEHQDLHREQGKPRYGRWSLEHDACLRCGTTERKHHAHGLCSPCLQRVQLDQTKTRHGRKSDHPNDWSFRYERCVDCGTTERPHRSRGRCGACYRRWLRHRT